MGLVGILLGAIYIVGIVKFLMGIEKTNFTQNKFLLAILWPALVIVNGNYRRNFTKALKG